jgi:hypothetical protein
MRLLGGLVLAAATVLDTASAGAPAEGVVGAAVSGRVAAAS